MNVLDHNLGINARGVAAPPEDPLQLLPTDSQPAVFWITNVNNTIINNTAVGGKFVYWFSMPEKPTGLSATKYANDRFLRPICQPLLQFDDNTAHGAGENGFHCDDMVGPDGSIADGMYYPLIGPFDPKQPCSYSSNNEVEANIRGFLAYKNRRFGIWGRSDFNFDNAKILDNRRGFQVTGFSFLTNSMVVGETDNV